MKSIITFILFCALGAFCRFSFAQTHKRDCKLGLLEETSSRKVTINTPAEVKAILRELATYDEIPFQSQKFRYCKSSIIGDVTEKLVGKRLGAMSVQERSMAVMKAPWYEVLNLAEIPAQRIHPIKGKLMEEGKVSIIYTSAIDSVEIAREILIRLSLDPDFSFKRTLFIRSNPPFFESVIQQVLGKKVGAYTVQERVLDLFRLSWEQSILAAGISERRLFPERVHSQELGRSDIRYLMLALGYQPDIPLTKVEFSQSRNPLIGELSRRLVGQELTAGQIQLHAARLFGGSWYDTLREIGVPDERVARWAIANEKEAKSLLLALSEVDEIPLQIKPFSRSNLAAIGDVSERVVGKRLGPTAILKRVPEVLRCPWYEALGKAGVAPERIHRSLEGTDLTKSGIKRVTPSALGTRAQAKDLVLAFIANGNIPLGAEEFKNCRLPVIGEISLKLLGRRLVAETIYYRILDLYGNDWYQALREMGVDTDTILHTMNRDKAIALLKEFDSIPSVSLVRSKFHDSNDPIIGDVSEKILGKKLGAAQLQRLILEALGTSNWYKALRTAGIDPFRILSRLNRRRAIRLLKALHRHGEIPMSSELFSRSDHPAIREISREIVGRALSPRYLVAAVIRLFQTDWYGALEKAGIPTEALRPTKLSDSQESLVSVLRALDAKGVPLERPTIFFDGAYSRSIPVFGGNNKTHFVHLIFNRALTSEPTPKSLSPSELKERQAANDQVTREITKEILNRPIGNKQLVAVVSSAFPGGWGEAISHFPKTVQSLRVPKRIEIPESYYEAYDNRDPLPFLSPPEGGLNRQNDWWYQWATREAQRENSVLYRERLLPKMYEEMSHFITALTRGQYMYYHREEALQEAILRINHAATISQTYDPSRSFINWAGTGAARAVSRVWERLKRQYKMEKQVGGEGKEGSPLSEDSNQMATKIHADWKAEQQSILGRLTPEAFKEVLEMDLDDQEREVVRLETDPSILRSEKAKMMSLSRFQYENIWYRVRTKFQDALPPNPKIENEKRRILYYHVVSGLSDPERYKKMGREQHRYFRLLEWARRSPPEPGLSFEKLSDPLMKEIMQASTYQPADWQAVREALGLTLPDYLALAKKARQELRELIPEPTIDYSKELLQMGF